jgi:VanZ family protein
MGTEAVALKLPAMWTEDMETWFFQAEAQFEIRKISVEKTKFYHVVSALPQECASKVKDLIRNPPAENPYAALKAALLSKYEMTEHERAAAIFAITSLGDSKPSQVMDRIRCLLGGLEGGILLRYHFLSTLPEAVRNPLAISTTTDLGELAIEADRIFLSTRDVGTHQVLAAGDDAEDVDRVQARHRDSRNRAKTRTPTASGLCFYHERFGSKAKKCEQGCRFTQAGNGPAGQRR